MTRRGIELGPAAGRPICGVTQADVLRSVASLRSAVVINLCVLTSVGAPNGPEPYSYQAALKAE
jgi:hypothetical protein